MLLDEIILCFFFGLLLFLEDYNLSHHFVGMRITMGSSSWMVTGLGLRQVHGKQLSHRDLASVGPHFDPTVFLGFWILYGMRGTIGYMLLVLGTIELW